MFRSNDLGIHSTSRRATVVYWGTQEGMAGYDRSATTFVIEECILMYFLVSISLLAMAGGSLAWGILGDHVGRRRALISALSVAVLFSAVASVMPTYALFMTAR